MRFLPTALAAMLLAVLLGCGPVFAPSVNDASDEDATAAEIVEAGAPVAADRAGDGRLLAVYSVVRSEGPEVSQTAWRLYDADGVTVASRSTTAASGRGRGRPRARLPPLVGGDEHLRGRAP